VTREADTFVPSEPEDVDVELYGQSNRDRSQPRVYINENWFTAEQARTLALALLELVTVAEATRLHNFL
jgi:hypothetical protein